MTIEEAIKYWEYRYNRAKNNTDIHWEADERHEHQEYVEALQIAVNALKENAELKRLLRLAVEDLYHLANFEGVCRDECKNCPFERTGKMFDEFCWECHWKHADEAEKMLKGE